MHCIKPSEDKNLVAQLILAHGAGAGSQSEFMQSIANGLSEIGIKTWLFDFPYMQTMYELGKRRPPDRAEKLKTADKLRERCERMHPDMETAASNLINQAVKETTEALKNIDLTPAKDLLSKLQTLLEQL